MTPLQRALKALEEEQAIVEHVITRFANYASVVRADFEDPLGIETATDVADAEIAEEELLLAARRARKPYELVGG